MSPSLRIAIEAVFVAVVRGRPCMIRLEGGAFSAPERARFLLFTRQLGRCQACRGGLS